MDARDYLEIQNLYAGRRAALCSLAFLGCLFATLATAPSGMAQNYPNKPIRMVIPNPPGGNSDLLGRAIAAHLQERLGQPVVPDNKAGAGGIIAAEIVAKAAPDGYTLFMGNIGPNAVNQSLYRQLPYNAAKDFTPITLVMKVANILVVHPSVKANSVQELIALAKTQPGVLTFASSGQGQSPHLSGELFMKRAGVSLSHIPYKGAAPSMAALLSGEVNMIFENITNASGQIKAGTIRALGVTGDKRSKILPEVPTIAESGLPGYEVTSWFGMFGPADMPPTIVDLLNKEIRQWIDLPATQEKISAMGGELVGNSPAEFGAFVQSEISKWKDVVESAKMQID